MVNKMSIKNARYLKVDIEPYWEDVSINGEEMESAEGVPFAKDDQLVFEIDLLKGEIVDWPKGVKAFFHCKVCDAGLYVLLDENKRVISTRADYVPDGVSHGAESYGDYVILNIDENGKIDKFERNIDKDEWEVEL